MVADAKAMARHLVDWAGAVVKAWWGYAAFIVCGLIVTAHDRIDSIPLRWEDLEVPVLTALPFAFFQVWREQRIKAEASAAAATTASAAAAQRESELREAASALVSTRLELDQERKRNTPNLIARIDRVLWGGDTNVGVALVLTLTVRNRPPCAPSIAEHWEVRVTSGNSVEHFMPSRIPDDFRIGGDLPGGTHWTESFSESEAIYHKTIETPIEPGGSRTGVLLTIFENHTDRVPRSGV